MKVYILEFILPDSYVAITAEETSLDTTWFVKINKIDCCGNGNGKDTDDYGHVIPPGAKFLKGHYLEKLVHATTASQTHTFYKGYLLYKESVVYPFISFELSKRGFNLNMLHYIEILKIVKQNSFSRL